MQKTLLLIAITVKTLFFLLNVSNEKVFKFKEKDVNFLERKKG